MSIADDETESRSEHGPDATLTRAPESPGLTAPARAPLERGTLIGRYVILEPLGVGGLGAVFAAFDPELERRVALKLVRFTGQGTERARQRLLREARAVAKLAHPNVVAVHDVGTWQDEVFVAMELVAGGDLARWLGEPRTPAAIIDVFVRAGRGLAAAHDAGLVHRDFKPHNVLMGADRRPRVADFGLARAMGTHPDDTAGPEVSNDDALTRQGAVMGTPAYMAPEQLAGDDVDARADQYAFCVALWEALHDELPFPTTSFAELRAAKLSPTPPRVPARSRMPGWLRPIVLRGLACKPVDRYPSMHALLSALERARTRRPRRAALTGLAVLTGGAIALVATGVVEPGGGPSCKAPAAALAGIWDDATRQATQRSMLATERGNAGSSFERVAAVLDRYTDDWLHMQVASCEATRVYGTQSDELLDLRTACLDRRLAALGGLTALLQEADAAVVERAVDAALALPPIADCGDLEALRRAPALPADPVARARSESLRRELIAAEATASAGRIADALPVVRRVRAQAEAIDDRALLASARYREAELIAQDDGPGAETLLRETLPIAAAVGDDALVASAWLKLISVVGTRERRFDEAMSYRLAAETAIARDGSEARLAFLHEKLGSLLVAQARYDDAEPHYRKALEIYQRLPDHRDDVAGMHDHFGALALERGQPDRARGELERALAIAEEVLGSEHLDIAIYTQNLGVALERMGEASDALAAYQRALGLLETIYGPDSSRVGRLLANIAGVHGAAGRLDEAQAALERSLAILRAAHGEGHPELAGVLANLGSTAQLRGELDVALDYYQQALAIEKRVFGESHPAVGQSLYSIGDVQRKRGALDEAAVALTGSLRALEATLPAEHPLLSYPLHALGQLALDRNQPAAAIEPLERALALLAGTPDAALVQYDLGRARWDSARDRTGARALVQTAHDTLAATPGTYDDTRERAAAWLRTHR